VISCVYCGGAHERPADIRQCWADHEGDQPELPLDPEPSEFPPSPAVAGRQRSQSIRTGSQSPAPSGHRVPVPVRRGPVVLGRNLVVGPAQSVPDDWSGIDRVVIDAGVLADPSQPVAALRTAANDAIGHVIELAVEFDAAPESIDDRHPHEVGADHAFLLDELHHLVWSNSIDARAPDACWGAIDRAVAQGATAVAGDSSGDIICPDGAAVWIDAGPIRHLDQIDGIPVVHAVQIEHGSFRSPKPNRSDAALAPDQLAAVTHPGGPARIIAPAGSGKTRVLTERARHLLDVWRLPASAVSLVAFNKRAQEEMVGRTSDLPGLQVRTLNAIALAIVNGRAPFAPQQRSWRTIDEPDVRRILQRFVTVPRRRNTDPIAPWIDALSLVRLGLVDPTEVALRYGGDVDGLGEVYPQYVAAL
jgi:DNA helicase-2/ATP-dependent DNA helicase PcrA